MKVIIFLLFMALVLAVIAAKTFIIVKEGEGVAVFRLDQFLRISRPGLVMVIPFVDKIVRVSLQGVPRWETMPDEALKEKILELVAGKQK